MTNYYCLVTGLPELSLEDGKLSYTVANFRTEVYPELSKEEDIASDIISLDAEAEETDNYLNDTLTLSDTISDVNVDMASAALEDEDILGNEDILDGTIPGEAVYTSTQALSSLAGVKLIKEQTRAKNKETLLEIINSTSLSESQNRTQ